MAEAVLRRFHSRRGFSVAELLIGIVVAGLLLAIAAPRIREALAVWNVRSARAAVANVYAQARVVAVQRRLTATVRLDGNRVYITVPNGAALDTVGGVTDVAARYGATLTAAGGNLTVFPTGLVNAAAPIVLRVSRGAHADSVLITGYGRVQ
jgi:prepilin-type N-terminal cleavage/methylation domain-containing protein